MLPHEMHFKASPHLLTIDSIVTLHEVGQDGPMDVVNEKQKYSEKRDEEVEIEVNSLGLAEDPYDDAAKIYIPGDNDVVMDPRLKNYPIPLVARTVDLHNDFS